MTKNLGSFSQKKTWDHVALAKEIHEKGYEPFGELIELARSSDEKVRLSANKTIVDKLIATRKHIERDLSQDAKQDIEKLRQEMQALIASKTKDY